jgi:hypothetical protein
MSLIPSNPSVQEKLEKLRDKKAVEESIQIEQTLRKQQEEKERIEDVRKQMNACSDALEAEILFEIEKLPNLLSIVLDPVTRSCHNMRIGREIIPVTIESTSYTRSMISAIRNGLTEANISPTVTLPNEIARFRIRLLTNIIESTRQKEEARKQSEIREKVLAEKEAQAAKQAAYTELMRNSINNMVMTSLDSHPNLRTLSHNFTDSNGTSSTLFVAYTEQPSTGERYLRVLKATQNGFEDPFISSLVGSFTGPSESPPPIPVPSSWATQYEAGKIPFLPVCPTCGKATLMYKRQCINGVDHNGVSKMYKSGGQVECKEHYKWEPATNTHHMWTSFPPRVPDHIIRPPTYPTGQWILWDPKDPDGKIAATLVRDKKITDMEAEIEKLQAQLSVLRTIPI